MKLRYFKVDLDYKLSKREVCGALILLYLQARDL